MHKLKSLFECVLTVYQCTAQSVQLSWKQCIHRDKCRETETVPRVIYKESPRFRPGSRTQSDKTSHIDMEDDSIDTIISHIISSYPISISRMTISIC